MILKGNQRGGGKQLARHLLNAEDNEHVHVHDMRGFLADDLTSAFHEAYAVSRGTRAKQFLFSLSLNPPLDAKVSTEEFEKAIDVIEDRLGLTNQPRAIVFHEKDGRRHAHAVWSRIDAAEMKAINLPFYKTKLREAAKELYLEHGWQMPRAFVDSRERDPANFSHAEWQQAKRGGHDPKALKGMFQECWASSDSGKSFAQALRSRGYVLARGDRRGHVAVDYRGEVYAIAKFVGVKTKDVKDRLGEPETLPDLAQAKQEIAQRMTAMLQRHVKETEDRLKAQSDMLARRKADLVQRQRQQRADPERRQAERWTREARERSRRVGSGWRGLWDRVSGRHAQIRKLNERETLQSFQRDHAEKDSLIFAHIEERQDLHALLKAARARQAERVAALHRDIGEYDRMSEVGQSQEVQAPEQAGRKDRQKRGAAKGNDFGRDW